MRVTSLLLLHHFSASIINHTLVSYFLVSICPIFVHLLPLSDSMTFLINSSFSLRFVRFLQWATIWTLLCSGFLCHWLETWTGCSGLEISPSHPHIANTFHHITHLLVHVIHHLIHLTKATHFRHLWHISKERIIRKWVTCSNDIHMNKNLSSSGNW